MRPDIKYVKLDGRGENESFQNCVLDALKNLKAKEGIHIIKEFEPLPLFALMEKRGFNKYLVKKSDSEYHAWFFPNNMEDKMKDHLNLDMARIQKMLDIKLLVFRKEITPFEAKKIVNKTFDHITAEEFAYGEQHMLNYGITDDIMAESMDDIMAESMDDIIDVFKDVLETNSIKLAEGHPIQTYINEAEALLSLLSDAERQLNRKFIKNEWLNIYEKLNEINVHFSRKQNQLFSVLEQKGFDRPSKVMWTFDNNVRDAIKEAYNFLHNDEDSEFLKVQKNVIHLVRDILEKEQEILYPTSLKLISDTEFEAMRISDDEIGYCLIDTPPAFNLKNETTEMASESTADSELLTDLMAVLNKHGVSTEESKEEVLDVSMGKLSLSQINLIFKHLQVDLSYVDENDVVKFYSDTKHRVFPRSAGVIGRKVQNCHPRESVKTVEDIIAAFKKGEQDKAEFWLEMGGKFLYIIYNAVRDEKGVFKGVLEMMQDVTHIRSLTGSQKLLSWDNKAESNLHNSDEPTEDTNQNHGISKASIIAPLLKKHPYLKDFLIALSPKYKQLNNPVVFNTMGNIASLEMIGARGGFETHEFVEKIIQEVNLNKK